MSHPVSPLSSLQSPSAVPGFFYLYVEISKFSHCLHLQNYWSRLASLPAIFSLALYLWQQPLCLDSKAALVISEQVSPRASYEPLTISASSAALSPGAGGSAGESLFCVSTSEGSVQSPGGIPATTLSPGTVAHAVHSGLLPVPSLSIPREARVPGQLSSLLNAPLCTRFSLSAAALRLRE